MERKGVNCGGVGGSGKRSKWGTETVIRKYCRNFKLIKKYMKKYNSKEQYKFFILYYSCNLNLKLCD